MFVCLFLRKDNGYAGYNTGIAFTTWILTLQIFPAMAGNHFYPTYITLTENLLWSICMLGPVKTHHLNASLDKRTQDALQSVLAISPARRLLLLSPLIALFKLVCYCCHLPHIVQWKCLLRKWKSPWTKYTNQRDLEKPKSLKR